MTAPDEAPSGAAVPEVPCDLPFFGPDGTAFEEAEPLTEIAAKQEGALQR